MERAQFLLQEGGRGLELVKIDRIGGEGRITDVNKSGCSAMKTRPDKLAPRRATRDAATVGELAKLGNRTQAS